MRRFVLASALAAVAGLAGIPAHGAVNTAVAGPGAAVAAGYATPTVVVTRAVPVPATFVNADPLAPHDVQSVARRKVGTKMVPLFKSALISAGETATIEFLPGVPAGDYPFICSLHPGTMKATLTLLD